MVTSHRPSPEVVPTAPRIFIMADMEGISGITRKSQILPDLPDYSSGRRYLAGDVNACVDGCFAAGASKVVVRDAHFQGFNLIWDTLDERAEYVQGGSPRQRLPHIDDFDALILLGYHSMAGTHEGVLEHTMSSMNWQNLWINGVLSGEIAICSTIAAEHGVPTILVTGDDKTCAEARRFIPGVHTVQVKEALDCQGAQLLSQPRAHSLIRKGAQDAVQSIKDFRPNSVASPVTMRLELVERGIVPYTRAGVTLIDGRTYEVTAPTVEEALKQL